ncbi:MAG: O-methyltransferase [Actinobacteria bacterium]|nr:O-methyltransferase [Actinomycetota bacterium]
MSFRITDERIETYTKTLLARHDNDVLNEMEDVAAKNNFPIVGRMVGVTLEILTRSMNARRIFELGSGYGYSGYWFAHGAGDGREVHLTDGDPANEGKAIDYLKRAGLSDGVTFHLGDALTSFASVDGEFDIVYCDIDKHGYPDAWRAARDRVRVGGLYICDNTLWSGRVAEEPVQDDVRPGWTEAIKEQNEMISSDERYLSMILPIRDGVMVAHRLA